MPMVCICWTKAESLRQWMHGDEKTLLYECTQLDPEGLRLARQWAEEYVKM